MNLKKIKDSNLDKVAKLLGMLVEQSNVADSIESDCSDLLLGASISNLSDADIVIMWETSYATDAERKAFMDYMSEKLDLPESLDDFVYDYAINSRVDMGEVLTLLNEWLPKDVKKSMCSELVDQSKIDDSAEELSCLEELMNDYPITPETIMKQFSVWAPSDKVQEFLNDFAKAYDIEELESIDSASDLGITSQQLVEELNQWLDSDTKKEFIQDLLKDLDLEMVDDSLESKTRLK